MTKFRVSGLLDRPSSESLGMVGLVVEPEKGELYSAGVIGSSRPLARDEFADLVKIGDAQAVDGPVIDANQRNCAALWVGNDFAEKAERLAVQLPPLPKTSQILGDRGMYWVGPAQHIWRVIDSWIVRAFQRAIRDRSEELANLMAWALPERKETRAALWYTCDATKRESNLEWWVHLERSHGIRTTPKALVLDYQKSIDELHSRKSFRVYGFGAWAKGGDNEIAKFVSDRLHTPRLSFGQFLRHKAELGGMQPTRRLLQQHGQEMIEKYGALEFCLEVLDSLPLDISIPNAQFVIDGIRHAAVLDSLIRLVGEDRFTLVFIDRPKDVRRELLVTEEGIPHNEVESIMNDSTEKEVPIIEDRAFAHYDREKLGIESIGKELVLRYGT